MISEQYGLSLDGKEETFLNVVNNICRELDLSVQELSARVKNDSDVLKKIVEHLTISESSFFRNIEQLNFITQYIRNKLFEMRIGDVNIWSAGCAQGEEPYSLAILLKETLSPAELKRVNIIANDINSKVISAAKKGVYSKWSLRENNEELEKKYLEQTGRNEFRLHEDIRQMVAFYHRSIQDLLTSHFEPESLDVVMFRNVAIHLNKACLPSLNQQFSRVIKPDGLLCSAYCDLLHMNPPNMRRIEGAAGFWQKCPQNSSFTSQQSILPPSPPQEQKGNCEPIQTPSSVMLQKAMDNITQMKFDKAKQIAAELISKGDANMGNYILGRVAMEEGQMEEAKKAFRTANYLDSDNYLIQFWRAVILFDNKEFYQSFIILNTLKENLTELEPQQVLFDGKTTVGEVTFAVNALLQAYD